MTTPHTRANPEAAVQRTDLPLPRYGSLVEMLAVRAEERPDHLAARFLGDGEQESERWSYGELAARAHGIAARLRGLARPGERALLLYPPGLEYIAAFFGCLEAGVLAVPAYPPDPHNLARTLPRLAAIIADSGASVALTTAAIAGFGEPLMRRAAPRTAAHLRWLATDPLPSLDRPAAPPTPGELAFLQYTSGSTASPKGVMVGHDNLLANFQAIVRTLSVREGASFVSWLPPYHDMGLIGCILCALYVGGTSTTLGPYHFLQRPVRWLQAITRYRGEASAAPNFAFELLLRRVTPEQRTTLDLLSWTAICNGAEPISPGTLRRFAEAYAPVGFREESFVPCFGLAEGTLIVSGAPAGGPNPSAWFERDSVERGRPRPAEEGHAGARHYASSGPPVPDHEVRVVDPDRRVALPDGVVGELWVRGPSVARGYWERDDATEATFDATLADTGEGPWLRTGDLGFLHGGEVYVTGRIKDLIIVAGQNHYPQDLERSAEAAHPALRPGASAAFTVEVQDSERAVLVVEVDERAAGWTPEQLRERVVAAVAREHQLALHDVLVVRAREVPRTSSGKVQRRACRAAWLDGSLARAEAAEAGLAAG